MEGGQRDHRPQPDRPPPAAGHRAAAPPRSRQPHHRGRRQAPGMLGLQGQQKGWWTDFEDVLPAGFDIYVGLEAEAASLRDYHTHLVHGLLQTEDYARTLLRAMRLGDDPDDVERLVTLRMRRQPILRREGQPLDLWAVLDEAVLRRPIGGPTVMREQ